MNRLRTARPPTPWVIGTLLLSLALAASALAGTDGLSSKISKSKVRQIAKKQAAKQIDEREASLNVNSARTADAAAFANSAKSADSATKADSATDADTVGKLAVRKFSVKQAPGTALTPIATIGLVELRAGCQSDGDPLLSAFPAGGSPTQAERFSVVFANGTTKAGGQSFFTGQAVLDGSEELATGEIATTTGNGAVTTIQFGGREANNFEPNENVCVVWGTGVGG